MPSASHLPTTLQQTRKTRRLSQLELSFRLGVSQRHVSFVETGRARPSRELLLAWLDALEVPLGVRNEALLQAGYAPVYGSGPLDGAALSAYQAAIGRLLDAHDPMPAFVLDANWRVLRINRGAQWLAMVLLPPESFSAGPLNMLDLLTDPEGVTKRIVNLNEVGPPLLQSLRREAIGNPTLAPKVQAFERLLHDRLGVEATRYAVPAHQTAVLTTRYATDHGLLAFFSMFTTFGSPQDITLASLRIEHLFAADELTSRVVRAAV